MTSAEDPELPNRLARARAGERRAFDELAAESGPRLLRSAAALCRDAELARDLAQETLVEAWKSLSRFDGRSAFATWLHAILRHRFLKAIRRARSRPVLHLLDAVPDTPDPAEAPAEQAGRAEQAARLRALVDRLPEEQRQVLHLRFFADASLQEIAAALDCPEGTVKSRLHHGLRTLREKSVNLSEAVGNKGSAR